jgi:hypothetical protein
VPIAHAHALRRASPVHNVTAYKLQSYLGHAKAENTRIYIEARPSGSRAWLMPRLPKEQ